MPYTCQTCARRKVKCDKLAPTCSSCSKSKLECFYQEPAPQRRKRRLSEDAMERLARYERILRHHGLLEADMPLSVREKRQDPISFHWNEPEASRTGTLLAEEEKSRYISGNPWSNLGDEEVRRVFDEEEQGYEEPISLSEKLAPDPLTGVLMGSQHALTQLHPTHAEALILWETHVENIEPLCKILHIPSTAKIVSITSQQPEMASKAEVCLLFSISHFAVFSMTDEECAHKLGHSRAMLMQRYHFGARQALVNAAFLKTSSMTVLQALVLFLLSCRYYYDSQTYWILTGVAVRIGQRMGLHRDGKKLGLLPFDVQMRRRLFYQLLPLDARASQMAGTTVSVSPGSCDTEPPLNINDDQIWPGMTEDPEEYRGATEMIFCLSRSCIGTYLASMRPPPNNAGSWKFTDYQEAERVIDNAEREVEDKYIRYCDIVNPLHFLTIGLARAGITAMRLRLKLTKVRNQTVTDSEMRELFQLAEKILDTDTAISTHSALTKYRWHVRPFFLWGTYDSFVFTLTSLWRRSDLLSPSEIDAIWRRVEQLYHDHEELLQPRALYVALRRLTLKAWDACPPSTVISEPVFIVTLRSLGTTPPCSLMKTQQGWTSAQHANSHGISPATPSSAANFQEILGPGIDNIENYIVDQFNLDTVDWGFWDNLIQSHQEQTDQQQ
ncbi:hypothetical protein Plec18167_000667 [Paecilomyces lecythidis]|uniref:Zn(2)-C6 fungal-type domain-containing protein n=1 Tax=Paecilomyces lecythidis TaxID=3004212 RepID=A0ABR3YEL5_9EURO